MQTDLTKLKSVGCDHRFLPLKDTVKDYVQNYLEKADPYL